MKTRFLILIGFCALTMASVPLEAITSDDAHLGGDACCASVPEHAPEDCCLPDDDHGHDEADACPPGCDGCFLPCCTGLACDRPVSIGVDADTAVCAALIQYHVAYLPADPDAIFHPPQI